MGYAESCQLLERLTEARAVGEIEDTILVLEYPPVITIGQSPKYKAEHLLVSEDVLTQEGISVYHTKRGGGITYHGPGQLVCYPIFDLKSKRLTVRQYIHGLEEVVIRTLARFNLSATRSSMAGISVGDDEICAIGICISRHISGHGFALNVNTNLRHFSLIVPCGVVGKSTTSVARLLGYDMPLHAFVRPLIDSFRSVFNLNIKLRPRTLLARYYEE